jgi:ABC-type iron transport system FetAB permease component
METLTFILGIFAIIYLSYRLGKEKGILMASERAVEHLILMGFLKEKENGEITKGNDDQIK